MSKNKLKTVVGKHKDRKFLICCPGKNVIDYIAPVKRLIAEENLITIGSNKISELIDLDYHLFTNNDKYKAYGTSMVKKSSTLVLGNHILKTHIRKHSPSSYISVKYTDKNASEPINYNRKMDVIEGYYRTSGNLAIMLCHLMGAEKIYITGMSGFTWNFDGKVHYYTAEIKRDKKPKKAWKNNYDKPVSRSLDNLKKYGIVFSIITPTIYSKHYDESVLKGRL